MAGDPGSDPAKARVYDATTRRELGIDPGADADYLGGVYVGGKPSA